jgi:protein TonB
LLHWDLRPENILIGADGIPWLVDFGAARFVMRFKYRSIRSVAVPGYAPPEVYSATANPGPTLDLYSAAATLYHAICGNPPPDSLLLSRGEATLTPALKLGFNRYPSEFLRAVDWGLRLDPEQRPQSAAQWREAIAGRASIPAAVATTAAASAAPAPAAVVAATAPAAAPAARSEPAARPGKARKNTLRPSPELELQSKPLRMGLAIGGVLVAGAVVVALNMGHKDDDTATTAAAQPAASKSQQPAAAAAAVATRNNSNLPAALDQFAARLNRQAAERAADEARKNSERRQHERDAARERDQARQDAEPSRPQLAAGAAPAAAPSPAQRAAPPSRPATAGSQHPAAQPAQFAHQPAAAPVTTARTQVATIAKAPAVHIPPTRDTSRPCAAPEYPAASREAGETGTTIVDLLIGTDGRVMQSRIAQSSGHKRLDEAARIAFARCKWKAGTVDGEPEMSWAVLKLAWRLR